MITLPRLYEIKEKTIIDLNKVICVQGPYDEGAFKTYKVFLSGMEKCLEISDFWYSYDNFMKAWELG